MDRGRGPRDANANPCCTALESPYSLRLFGLHVGTSRLANLVVGPVRSLSRWSRAPAKNPRSRASSKGVCAEGGDDGTALLCLLLLSPRDVLPQGRHERPPPPADHPAEFAAFQAVTRGVARRQDRETAVA